MFFSVAEESNYLNNVVKQASIKQTSLFSPTY